MAQSSGYGKEFVELPVDSSIEGSPIRAIRNRHFLVQVRQHAGYQTMSVNRAALDDSGHWREGISWDELQSMKEMIWPGEWAAEYFPPESEVVCVANMRHLVKLNARPVGAWTNGTP